MYINMCISNFCLLQYNNLFYNLYKNLYYIHNYSMDIYVNYMTPKLLYEGGKTYHL